MLSSWNKDIIIIIIVIIIYCSDTYFLFHNFNDHV